MIHSVSDNKSNQDNVDVDDLIPYRMLRDRIEKHNEKVKKFLETSEKDSTNEISAEISGQIYPTTSSPSNPNKSKAEGGEKENDGEKLKLIDTSPRPLSLSSVSSSPSLILSPASEDKSGHSIPIFQSPRYSRQRHFSSSTAKFSSPFRGASPHLSPVQRTLPRGAPPMENSESWNHPVPGRSQSRLQPQNDTLAQFEEAMRNMEKQKRVRKLLHSKQKLTNKELNINNIPEKPSPIKKRRKSQRDETEYDLDAVNESQFSTPSPIPNAMRNCSSVSDGNFANQEVLKDDDVRNSKHILCSGQIVQDPVALAEIKKTDSSENNKDSTLKKALDNMKFVDEERMRKQREKLDSPSESEKMKRKEKKKRKKEKLEKAERTLRKLLKKKGLEKEVLAKFLKKAKKKSKNKGAEVIELEDVSSPEPLITKELCPKLKSPIIERRFQRNEGKMQVFCLLCFMIFLDVALNIRLQNVYQVETDREVEKYRERMDEERDHRRDGGHHHYRPRYSGDPREDRYRSPVQSSYYSNTSRHRHQDFYSRKSSWRR